MNKATDIAGYFVDLASKIDESDLTNLKLQKMLYLAQGEYLVEHENPLFGEPIEAWEYGPVVREVYLDYKKCGAFPITVFDMKKIPSDLDDDIREFLDKFWENTSKFSASYLVGETHKKNSPWEKVYTPGEKKTIPIELIKDYFVSNRNFLN